MAVIEERRNKEGKVTYRVKIRIKGHKPLSATFDRKTDALDWASEMRTQLRRRRHLNAVEAETKTLRDLIAKYRELELPKRTRPAYQKISSHLKWWDENIGHLLLKDVTPSVLAECRDRLLVSKSDRNRHINKPGAGLKSPATVTWYMASLSHALSVSANEWQWIDSNPMLKVKKPKLPASRVRFLDDEERSALLEACRKSPCSYLYPVVVVALSTGARYSEIMNLRWKDVDLDRGMARLEHTKNKERRALHLASHALQLIKDLHATAKPNKGDFLFPRADGMAPLTIKKHWLKALKEAGVEDFRFHDLRHSAASYLAMNGATLAEVAEVLGHKTLQMVKRYAHISEQHTAKVVARMNEQIFKTTDNNEQQEKG
ncbi:MAG: tyrosine-type recombinase/integrase [Ferrovibrio sp.]